MPDLPGYDTVSVEAWIRRHVPQLAPPLRWARLQGGHSNLTYVIEDSTDRKAVIRRPPVGELLPGAHDMRREWALISALGRTPVPVPIALGFCADTTVTGAPFYVMGHADGHSLYTAEDTRTWVPEDQRFTLACSLFDVLADLHAIDPDAIGLGDLGKKDDYIGRQLKTWHRSWVASVDAAQYDDPRAHSLHSFLSAHVPHQRASRIVHGDFGLHNCVVGADCTIAAVVDWEISTLGDPIADLAYVLNQWSDPSDATGLRSLVATALPGFPTRREMTERYAARTGADLSHLDYYVGFNYWKSAAIVHGVYARYRQGKKSSTGLDLESLKSAIGVYLGLSEAAVARLH